jgi:hypothetical protein
VKMTAKDLIRVLLIAAGVVEVRWATRIFPGPPMMAKAEYLAILSIVAMLLWPDRLRRHQLLWALLPAFACGVVLLTDLLRNRFELAR